MNEREAIELIRQSLDDKRYEHSLRVAETAKKLASIHEASIEKVVLASLLHDYAKCQSRTKLQAKLQQYELAQELGDYHHELWHGPVAAKELSVTNLVDDAEIIRAIYYHTTGHPDMGLLEVIVFVADYIEPARTMPGVEEVRELANENIYEAARMAIKNTIMYLMTKDAVIHPDSWAAYNEWTKNIRRKII